MRWKSSAIRSHARNTVSDSYAVLALLLAEAGADRVKELLHEASLDQREIFITAVSWARADASNFLIHTEALARWIEGGWGGFSRFNGFRARRVKPLKRFTRGSRVFPPG